MSLRFGECRLEVEARRLFRASREVRLPPKAFALLQLLIETRPRALSKGEILERVWPGVFVSDAALARVINQIRKSVGDPARRPRIIRTVHGYGYAFVADIDEAPLSRKPSGPRHRNTLWLVLGRRKFPLADGEHVIGREPDAAIWLDSPKVSRQHARIVVSSGRATLEDLGSKNGTLIRGERAVPQVPVSLETGDRIEIGPFTLGFRSTNEPRSTETAI